MFYKKNASDKSYWFQLYSLHTIPLLQDTFRNDFDGVVDLYLFQLIRSHLSNTLFGVLRTKVVVQVNLACNAF
jgi:hypothetical protein